MPGEHAPMGAANERDDSTADIGSQRGEVSAERVARNNATFRMANEQIVAKAAEWNMDGLLPALCECSDPHCTTVVRVTPRQYEAVRSDSRWFLNAPGHERNDQGWAHVISENDRFVVVEKVGEAGKLAEELDPRDNAA